MQGDWFLQEAGRGSGTGRRSSRRVTVLLPSAPAAAMITDELIPVRAWFKLDRHWQ